MLEWFIHHCVSSQTNKKKFSETAQVQGLDWKWYKMKKFKKPGELFFKSGFLDAKYEEIRGGLRLFTVLQYIHLIVAILIYTEALQNKKSITAPSKHLMLN